MKRGTSIVEVMIAIVVLMVTVAGVFPVMWWLIARAGKLKYETAAAAVLQEGMETAYNVLLTDWVAMEAGQTYSPQVVMEDGTERWAMGEGEDEVEARFTRGITVEEVCRDIQTGEMADCGDGTQADANSKMVTTTVEWNERGEAKVISARLLVVNL